MMTGFGVIVPWKDGILVHGGVNRPMSTDPKSALLHVATSVATRSATNVATRSATNVATSDSKSTSHVEDLGKDCEPVPLSHHAGCLIKVFAKMLMVLSSSSL